MKIKCDDRPKQEPVLAVALEAGAVFSFTNPFVFVYLKLNELNCAVNVETGRVTYLAPSTQVYPLDHTLIINEK